MTSSQLDIVFLLVINLALIILSIRIVISDRRLFKRLAIALAQEWTQEKDAKIAELEKFKDYYQELVEVRGYYGITDLLVADTKHKERIAELKKGYEELRIASLYAVCKMSGGQAKADLRDAYDKATDYLKALEE
jgi:hypothetical protein